MNNKQRIHALLILSLITTSLSKSFLYGQEIDNQYQTRTFIALSKEIIDDLTLEFTPELRWDDNFKLDRYLLNGELEYKPIKHLYIAACYRFIGKDIQDETAYLHRYQFNLSYKRKFDRWKPGARISYSNYSDDQEDDNTAYLRYKAFLYYNIKNCKITPKASVEIFHQLNDNCIYKYRSQIGANYKLSKKMRISLAYKFDFYKTKYRNRHIIDIGLKYKL